MITSNNSVFDGPPRMDLPQHARGSDDHVGKKLQYSINVKDSSHGMVDLPPSLRVSVSHLRFGYIKL